MVFCNVKSNQENCIEEVVTILILIDGFLQYDTDALGDQKEILVTILILIDGFLQFEVW